MQPTLYHTILDLIAEETASIKKFPDHCCAQVGTITAPAGRLATLANELKYNHECDPEKLRAEMRREAVTVAANCIKLLETLK